jgi:hypothetical protein
MKRLSMWAVCLGLLTACHYLKILNKQTLTLDAPSEVELVLYKQIGKNGRKVMNPIGLIRGGESMDLDAGDYLLANECSGYEFKQTLGRPIKIPVRRLKLELHGDLAAAGSHMRPIEQAETSADSESSEKLLTTPQEEISKKSDAPEAADSLQQVQQSDSPNVVHPTARVHTMCTDPLDMQKNQWLQRREFDILPGTTEIRIGGRVVKFENQGEINDPIRLDLYPVAINSQFPDIHARFYLSPEEKESKNELSAVSLEANTPTWLLPGDYTIEVNGTRRKVTVERGARTDIAVGVLRIHMPPSFPLEERLKLGGQPVFVYIDSGALLNLDTDYLVFPGTYTVSIEGTEVQEEVQVNGGEKTVIRTFAARVDVPPCSEQLKTCKSAPRITIHRDQKPYPLMIVEPRVPFLLLDGNYEYGVEGLRGIKKSLQKRSEDLAGEPLARVRLKWDVRQSQGRSRTDLVRIESRGQNTFGRSLDLLFHKPDEVYVPAGHYELTYFVGDPSLERSKSRQTLHLEPGQTRDVVIPLYVEKAARSEDSPITSPAGRSQGGVAEKPQLTDKLEQNKKPKEKHSQENAPMSLPRALTPLRR